MVSLAVISLLMACASASNSTVYVIRHGEKVSSKGCLSKQGEERANAIVGIFNNKPSSEHDTFSIPKAIFANNYDSKEECERCAQTVAPISKALGISVDHSHGCKFRQNSSKSCMLPVMYACMLPNYSA